MSSIRGLAQIFEYDCLDVDVYIGSAGVEQKRFEYLLFVDTREGRGLQLVRKERERLGKITLQSRVITAVVERRPPREVILTHLVGGNLGEISIAYDLPTAHVRDGDDKRLQPRGSSFGAIEERKQS